jgi:phenylpropionate dioxygenase-like ring-hydroxylating dioxygenase large terminal subunit
MTETLETTTLNQWYPIHALSDMPADGYRDRLLGKDILVSADGVVEVETGRALPLLRQYRYLWASLGAPEHGLFDLPEALEEDRRIVECGAVVVNASGLRIVENFLDMAHFPFVHTNILGAEPETEVRHYNTEIRRDVDEVWATDCFFYQPQAAKSATEGITTEYQYRVMSPFSTLLYKTYPLAASRWDVICLFVQPLEPGVCRAHPIMFLIDEESPTAELVHFQQLIFLQDRIILENQRPVLLPLDPGKEIPTRADASSVAYRRWLKEKGVRYGASAGAG